MWNRQNQDTHVEQLAFVTDKGIFWLSDANNTERGSDTGGAINYDGSPGNKSFYLNGVRYYIKAIVHTHPIGVPPSYLDGVSTEDRQRAVEFGVPIYAIADEGIGKGNANGTNAGIIERNYSLIFDCALDQNIVEELR